MKLVFNRLVLVMTEKCNAECDICLYNCSPEKNSLMDLNDAYDYIDQVAKLNSFKMVCITGGEPFLYYDNLIKIIKKAKSKFSNIGVSTNGFWGESIEKSEEFLKTLELEGVTELYLSVDEFHGKYISYQNIKNILYAGKKTNIKILLSSVVTKNSLKLKDISEILDDSVVGYNITEYPCAKVGRASEKIPEDEFIFNNKIPHGKCNKHTSFTVFPDGRVYPCCSITSISQLLSLGSLKDYTVAELIEKYENNIYCSLLRNVGSRWFTDKIQEKNLPIKLQKNYVALCELCGDLFASKEYKSLYDKCIDEEISRLTNKETQ